MPDVSSHRGNRCVATENIIRVSAEFRRIARSAVSDNDVRLSQQARCIYLLRS